MTAIGHEALADLRGQLARRGEHQHTNLTPNTTLLAASVAGLGEIVDDRKSERGRFPGARLRATEEVAAGQHVGNGLLLDWSRGAVACVSDGALNGRA